MGETPGSPPVSRKRQRSAQQARGSPEMVCNNVLHVIDRECLREASHRPQKSSAPGMAHVTAQQYAERLDENLRDRHERRRATRSVAPPVERVWIEQADGKTRPRGTPCFEDTSVQRAVVRILAAIVAQDFPACSHGFRKGHRPHHARHELREPCRTLPIHWRVDAEVRGCCDNVDWSHLRQCIQQRGSAGGIRRLIGTWLHAGVLEAGELRHPAKGTPQGGVSSPMLAKVCLHHVLDEWFVKDVLPRMQGHGVLTRVADDCIIGCEREADARRRMAVLPQRFTRVRLTMHPEKTALIVFKRPPSQDRSAGGTGTFALLGFTP